MKKKLIGRLGLILLAAISGMLLVFGVLEQILLPADTVPGRDSDTAENSARVFYNNTWYAPVESLETILILGIDTSESTASADTAKDGMGQADFLELLILDKAAQEFQLLHLNRDTMAEIFQTDLYGRDAGSFRGQLALAHAYGRDPNDGCRQTVKSVETLLYGISIDHYISFTMDAVSILNDRVGGVTLSLMDDFTHLDPAYQEGTVVTLTGTQALAYVRERGALEDSTNLRRMERQRQYLDGLFKAYNETAAAGEDTFSVDALLEVNDYMISDCTADQLSSLTATLQQYTYTGIRTLEGQAVKGHTYVEFHLDESAAQQTVLELFYTPVTEE
ncbi:MAG: LCP family protein [Clostridia bacterium]|nr:LCP family protein [Clostridia bacterium]